MTPPEQRDVALELEKLRGTVEAGFARLDGRLDLALQRTEQTEGELARLGERVAALEQRVWAASGVATALGAAIGYALQIIT
ncbi:hypothetical protein [Streptomyces boncukensis]|uniref:Uncharacterized protein n=1 Tax=Streptomyces boncukensis TaxID=2711219 RepID=A0A6G4X3C1_9ACTN|nr:hypothetical protein [Streptomyces boncukensis]